MSSKTRLKLLVAEDEPTTRRIYQGGFQKEYDLTVVEDGLKAFKLLKTQHFDCVVTDMFMPGMNGMELLNATKEALENPPPFILLSAFDSYELAVDFIQQGGADFMAKPLKVHDLGPRILKSIRDHHRDTEYRLLKKELDKMVKVKVGHDRYVRNFIHDASQPLMILNGFSELIKMNTDDEKIHKFNDSIRSSINYMTNWLNDLREMISEDLDRVEYHKVEGDLRMTVDRCVSIMHPLAHQTSMEISYSSPEDVFFNFDPNKIPQVVFNLLGNAIHYGEPGTEIKVNLEKTQDFIVLSVENRGDQIPEDRLELIFERFERASTKKAGLGIGLNICREIVESHRGTIEAQNLDDGVVFKVKLPLS